MTAAQPFADVHSALVLYLGVSILQSCKVGLWVQPGLRSGIRHWHASEGCGEMNPRCRKVRWDVEEMGPYRPSCCGVGYFETIQIRGVLLAADDCGVLIMKVGDWLPIRLWAC
jgi:hypothetical protein